jgi:opacity protein-like surface antigen
MFLIIAAAGAQITYSQSTGEKYRYEIFAGYSHNRIDTTLDSDDIDDEFDEEVGGRLGAHGVNLSVTGNATKYIGFKFDYAYHTKKETGTVEGIDLEAKYTNNTFMGGVQIKNNAIDGPRFKPFAHVLAGVARQEIGITDFDVNDFQFTQNNFTMAVGGGVDVRVTKHIDVRVIQIDYNPIFVKDFTFEGADINGRTQNNVRFGFGIVIH